MTSRVITFSLMVILSATHYAYAGEVKSITDKIYSNSFEKYNRFGKTDVTDTQSCETDNTGFITVYSITGKAQQGIDITLDGSPIGHLSTYFPDEMPDCQTPSAKGIITIMVPAGEHTLEAISPNLNWPGHTFTVEKCECMVLPLS
ncbi:MAG: hypothetical protein P8Y24_07500 [Gammaproteobacteria bacterium]